MNDEERRAKWREYSRRRYHAAKSDPELMAMIRAKNRIAARRYAQTPKAKAKRKAKDAERWLRIKSDPNLIAKKRKMDVAASKRKYLRTKADPDKYAAYLERKRKWRESNKSAVNARRSEWRKAHKKRIKRQARWYRDKLRALFAQSPELYALHRAQRRRIRLAYYDKTHNRKRAYMPKISMRIPDTCAWNRALDVRSTFLWNNQTAASLIAGRAYQQMMWREAHCDRFGEVCR